MTSSVASSRLLCSACSVAAAAWRCCASCCWAACCSFDLHMTWHELQCRTRVTPYLQKTVYLASSDCLRARWSLLSCMCRASASPAEGACMAAYAKQPSIPTCQAVNLLCVDFCQRRLQQGAYSPTTTTCSTGKLTSWPLERSTCVPKIKRHMRIKAPSARSAGCLSRAVVAFGSVGCCEGRHVKRAGIRRVGVTSAVACLQLST